MIISVICFILAFVALLVIIATLIEEHFLDIKSEEDDRLFAREYSAIKKRRANGNWE